MPPKSDSSEHDISELQAMLEITFPNFIGNYLFDAEGNYLNAPPDLSSIRKIVFQHIDKLTYAVEKTFNQYWPEIDRESVTINILRQYLEEMPIKLQNATNLLHLRMMWAVMTQKKYNQLQSLRLLKPEEEKILIRCRNYLKELNTCSKENYTLSVLANEGYLPGYGLYDGGIHAYAHQSFLGGGRNRPDFELSRNAVVAVREFVPGNMIYANNGRFKLVLYRFPAFIEGFKTGEYYVNINDKQFNSAADLKQKSQYKNTNFVSILGIPISDCDLHYTSRISDEEVNRFQLPVLVLGRLKQSRRGGKAFSVTNKNVLLLLGQKIQLLNLGPKDNVDKKQLGYPVCTVCGAVRSPFSSVAEHIEFVDIHKKRCGREPNWVALSAEDKVDGILIPDLDSEPTAINLGEALIIGASQILEMERNDLNTIINCDEANRYSLLIYDPMPGGSGLLNQILEAWQKVIIAAITSLENCPNACETSCYSCMKTYYNVYNHKSLDRKIAIKHLTSLKGELRFERDLEPLEEFGEKVEERGTNKGEISFSEILHKFGFPSFETQKTIKIGPPFNFTTPDFYYEDIVREVYVAVYLDGLSKNIHGNAERHRIDRAIRQIIESKGIEVVEIATSELNDPEALRQQLKILAAKIHRRDLWNSI